MSRIPDKALEILSLAVEIEQRCALLFQGWAHRFGPYDRGISGLLEELAEEERAHALEFRKIQEEVSGGREMEDIPLPPEFNACIDKLKTIEDHFFVTGPIMATTILEAALEIENFTNQFYRNAESNTTNAAVAAVCSRLSELEQNHVRIILERLEYEKQKMPVD